MSFINTLYYYLLFDAQVYTKPVQHEESKWWPARANPGELVIPPYAKDTHYRNDYISRLDERPSGSGRHTSNVDRQPALGTSKLNCTVIFKDMNRRIYGYHWQIISNSLNGYQENRQIRNAFLIHKFGLKWHYCTNKIHCWSVCLSVTSNLCHLKSECHEIQPVKT